MTDAEQIKRLRAMVTRLSDTLADRAMHSGLMWRDTPVGRAATKLLAETDPDPGPDLSSTLRDRAQLDEAL